LKAFATVNLPLHSGHAPAYLVRRMVALSYAISKIIVDEYGKHEFLKRLADPLWFQAFGCVLGFDWHSSGVTTVVTGVLKQSLKEDVHGISIAGGKGSKSCLQMNAGVVPVPSGPTALLVVDDNDDGGCAVLPPPSVDGGAGV
jgi:hypothetical protein